jgi:hypothetical protein
MSSARLNSRRLGGTMRENNHCHSLFPEKEARNRKVHQFPPASRVPEQAEAQSTSL